MEDLDKIEARYPDSDPIDNDVRTLIAELRRARLQVCEIQKRLNLQDFKVHYLREVLEKIASFRTSGCSTGEAMSKTEFRAKEALEVSNDDYAEKRICPHDHAYGICDPVTCPDCKKIREGH